MAVYEHPLLKFDSTCFLLQMAFRDGMFPGIATPAQLWEQRVPEGEPLLELRKDPSKLGLPVLRTVTRHGGLSDKMLDESTFRYYFQQMTCNAGYYGVLTIHALRRALANVVDSKLSFSASPPDVRRCYLPVSRDCHSWGEKQAPRLGLVGRVQ